MELLELIPFGKENAISRADLADLTGLSDRMLRKEIKRLLESGEPILSSSTHSGYWRSEDPSEWGRFIREYEGRAKAESKTIRKLKEKYYAEIGVRTTKVREHTRRLSKASVPEGQIKMEARV